MPEAFRQSFRNWLRRKEQVLPLGFRMSTVAAIDATVLFVGGVAVLQRPATQYPVAAVAIAVMFLPELVLIVFDLVDVKRFEAVALCTVWLTGTAMLLFTTRVPIAGDFAPLLLSLTVGTVTAIASIRGGILSGAAATAVLVTAAATHHVRTPALYLSFLAIGWLVGFLMRSQQRLLLQQQEMQAQLLEHAAADERRRIAREIHDVVAHSLSVTLLHLTGARLALRNGGVNTETVDALQRAEHLGRQAMADIRRTVGLLDPGSPQRNPEPGLADLDGLIHDFQRAGMQVTSRTDGSFDHISPAAGLALYRIVQESLANVARHAPQAVADVALTVSPASVSLRVVSELPDQFGARPIVHGRGLRGIRERIESLDGTIDLGPANDSWVVSVVVPLDGAAVSRFVS